MRELLSRQDKLNLDGACVLTEPHHAQTHTNKTCKICQVTSLPVSQRFSTVHGAAQTHWRLDLYPPAQCAPHSLTAFNCEAIQNNLAFPEWGQQGPWVPFVDLTFPLWEFHLGIAISTAVFLL